MEPDQFVKHSSDAGQPFYEAAGLEWLRDGGARTPALVSATVNRLVTSRIDPTRPTPSAARSLGRMLARMHAAGAPWWGAPPPALPEGADAAPIQGWMGRAPLPLLSQPDSDLTWGSFYAPYRIRPYVTEVFDDREAQQVELLCDALESGALDHPQPEAVRASGHEVARIHGDLWSGNVMWGHEGPVLIDPAAQGGHAEEDLATLRTFGTPFIDEVVAGYEEVSTLAPGWQARTGLHQLHILVVHCYLFGRAYIPQTMSAVSSALLLVP